MKRFVIRRHLFKGQITGGWYIWDKENDCWAHYVERFTQSGNTSRSEAIKIANRLMKEAGL
jgi:hypothetical protein